ncbi:hypothetical protein [Moorena sp. SIO4G3]|nr:hypothetical protein [Moorena sp. SIO4G3]NEO80958.1 hypothetical protein [Moorena sp. SIO4G3]
MRVQPSAVSRQPCGTGFGLGLGLWPRGARLATRGAFGHAVRTTRLR